MVKILILGGGFGGIRCALDLEKKLRNEADITLIDRNSYHLFTPALYEVASAFGLKKDPFAVQLKKTVCISYADIFQNKHVNFIQAEITSVDLSGREVKISGDTILGYDYLVFALGSEYEDYGIPGVREYSYKFKTIEDALMMNNRIIEFSEEFQNKTRENPFQFLICGAGFTGVELAAELSCCSKAIKARCGLKHGKCSAITLFEAANKILPMASEQERKLIINRLTKLGVIIMENSAVEEVGSDFIRLKTGQRIQGDMVIWNAGVKSVDFLKQINNLPLNQKGMILVEQNLAVKNFQNMFAIGDNVEFIDPKTQKVIPRLAYVSVDQGKMAAHNISAIIKNKRQKLYDPFYSVWIVPVGGKYAIAHLWGGWIIKNGFLGWIIREMVDLKYFLSIFSPVKAFKILWDEITVFTKND